jgi:dTMP kinase
MPATMPKRHVFVSIEGLKGSGKTTVSRLLAEQLGARWCTTPPDLFRPIRDAIQEKATPIARHLYYLAGIVQASAEIAGILTRQPVVCDKFVATMVAYSRAAGIEVGMPSQDLVIQPDFAFVLEVPIALRLKRIASRSPITPEQEAFVHMEETCDVMRQYRGLSVMVQDNSDAVTTSVARILQVMRCSADPVALAAE